MHPREGSVIEHWSAHASTRAKAKFQQRLRFLRDRTSQHWHADYAHQLADADRIFEIKFEANNVAHRPLCMFGPERNQITVLLFAIEHNNKWRPPSAIATAITRKIDVELGRAETEEYDPD